MPLIWVFKLPFVFAPAGANSARFLRTMKTGRPKPPGFWGERREIVQPKTAFPRPLRPPARPQYSSCDPIGFFPLRETIEQEMA